MRDLNKYIVFLCVLVVAAGLAFWGGTEVSHEIASAPQPVKHDAPSLADAVKQLGDEEHRIPALARLLAHNNISGLPENFRFWGDTTKCEIRDATNRIGVTFRMIHVSDYDTIGQHYVFIFDDNGECVLHSPDSISTRLGGLADITGDGDIEKLLWYGVSQAAQHKAGGHRWCTVLQVWRLHRGSSEILMDLYDNEDVDGEDVTFFVDASNLGMGRPVRIKLDSTSFQSLGTISWSIDEGMFVANNLDHRLEFRSGVPPSRCAFHSEQKISETKACPICGITSINIGGPWNKPGE